MRISSRYELTDKGHLINLVAYFIFGHIVNNLPLDDILIIWFIKQYEMQNDCLHGIFDHVGSSYYEQNLCLQMIL